MTISRIDFDTFTWQNLDADIHVGRHNVAVRRYLDSVVQPSIAAIDAMHAELTNSEDFSSVFVIPDIEQLHRSTVEAFTLAVQSLWERQLREFLKACARELKDDEEYVAKLDEASWKDSVKAFNKLRGVRMQEFDSYEDLDLLFVLANACRHGDGRSAKDLYKHWPDLWPTPPVPPAPLGHESPKTEPRCPRFSEVRIPPALIDRLGNAVIWFWEDHSYIHVNSLQRADEKHIRRELQRMREERARRPVRQSIRALRESDRSAAQQASA